MAGNKMYEGVWRGDEDPKQLEAFYWLVHNGYKVGQISDYVAEMESIEALQAIGDIYSILAKTGFKFGKD